MKQFPSDIKFKYDWRNYQKRLLDELELHLDDNHLHIIAPPGSGKTVLGLEVALRLNKPTLVFAPTVAIRNQWIQRFCEMFLQVEQKPDWISRDIRNPKFLTVLTYQALHAACTGDNITEEEEESEEEIEEKPDARRSNAKANEIIALLRAQNIGTIVIDEAHHLKNAWWKSLTAVKSALNPTIVGLTATPPYDVSYLEWQRYMALNGPVDAEISVPELVVEGDLCPHQDYVFFSRPTLEESHKIHDYRERIELLFQDLKKDETLIEALEKHPIYSSPTEQLEWIYSNLEYYSATLIFLNSVGRLISKEHLDVIGDKNFSVPRLNYDWIEILLTFYLFKDPDRFTNYEEHQEKLAYKLKRNGALERRSVNFRHHRKINNYLGSSISKLKSIGQIVEFEHDQLGPDLRMVILTDYIRKEFLLNEPSNDLKLDKIGVLPIFEQLRRNNTRDMKIGVLTGSLIIIPESAMGAFKIEALKYGIKKLNTSPLPFDKQYLVISSNEESKHDVVHIFTQVFQQGHIEVIVGTKSLLGEGWDAPSINSLILASFVGSYVLSNQMRGRAIRTERQKLSKTGNIWHLVCVDASAADGGEDVQLLKRRFKAFVGISFRSEISIENGIDRLDLPEQIFSDQEISDANERMFKHAAERDILKENWHRALQSGTILIEEIKVPFSQNREYHGVKSLHYNRTVKYLTAMLGSGVAGFGVEVLQALGRVSRHIKTGQDLLNWLMFAGGLGVAIFGRLTFKTFRIYTQYRDIAKDIHQIGEALLRSLIKAEIIHTDISNLTIVSEVDKDGSIYCHLKGGTTYEKSTFISSLQEIIGVVDNPKFVIIRKSYFLNVFSQKDYHSVPDLIGRKIKLAEYFNSQWRQHVGASQLVYTRTVEGRKLLLKSRIKSLASEFEDKSERINKWR